MPPQHIHCIYKSPTYPPQRTTHFSLLFFPSPVCLAQCTALLPRCCIIRRLPFSSMAPEWLMVIWMIDWLRHWDLVTVASLEIDLSTSTPNAVLLLMFEVMSPFMRGLPANQWLLSFWLLLPAMPSYLSFPLMTSGCSAALLLSHAQIAVSELIFKLLCSYRRENQAWEKKKGEEEEIRQCGLICTLA